MTKIEVLVLKHFANGISSKPNHYLVCVEDAFCSCLSHLWDGPIRDLCHHQHAVKLFLEAEGSEDPDKIRAREKLLLVNHFRNKERLVALGLKDSVIYEGCVEEVFDKILDQYCQKGSALFQPHNKETSQQDPFRPAELSKKRRSIIGCMPKNTAKPRGASKFPKKCPAPSSSQAAATRVPFSQERRTTTEIRNKKRRTMAKSSLHWLLTFVMLFRERLPVRRDPDELVMRTSHLATSRTGHLATSERSRRLAFIRRRYWTGAGVSLSARMPQTAGDCEGIDMAGISRFPLSSSLSA